MNQSGTFTNAQVTPTNQDIVVAFTPAENIASYTYQVYKDGIQINQDIITTNTTANIPLNDTGKYQIKVITSDQTNKNDTLVSEIYTVDKEAPVISTNTENITVKKGDSLPEISISAIDNYDGNITNNLQANDINTNEIGNQQLTYTVSDQAGNVSTKTIDVNITENTSYIFIFQIVIALIAFIIIYLIARFQRTLKLEKRIARFTIEPIGTESVSIIDRFISTYQNFIKKFTKLFKKSVFAERYSKKLDKYVPVSTIHTTGEEILAGKFITAFIFVLIAFITKTIQFQLLTAYEILLPLTIGFFLIDILYFTKYRIYRNKLENDLLSAITIMNNAFKSGRSITQAIETVNKEMEGEIANEFGKISLELTYGLDISTVFRRFAERIKIEEVNYLTASLTILNKTGGNIIEVFTAIEKSLFNKKKLKLELKSLTGASRIIVSVLLIIPFLFILVISLISPGYFKPFYETNLGLILSLLMLIYYIIFVICARKVMKVVI